MRYECNTRLLIRCLITCIIGTAAPRTLWALVVRWTRYEVLKIMYYIHKHLKLERKILVKYVIKAS